MVDLEDVSAAMDIAHDTNAKRLLKPKNLWHIKNILGAVGYKNLKKMGKKRKKEDGDSPPDMHLPTAAKVVHVGSRAGCGTCCGATCGRCINLKNISKTARKARKLQKKVTGTYVPLKVPPKGESIVEKSAVAPEHGITP